MSGIKDNKDVYTLEETQEAPTNDAVDENTVPTSTDDDIPMLDGWNNPVKSPVLTKEMEQRLQDKFKAERNPAQEMHDILNAGYPEEEVSVEDDLSVPRQYTVVEDPRDEEELLMSAMLKSEGVITDTYDVPDEMDPDVPLDHMDNHVTFDGTTRKLEETPPKESEPTDNSSLIVGGWVENTPVMELPSEEVETLPTVETIAETPSVEQPKLEDTEVKETGVRAESPERQGVWERYFVDNDADTGPYKAVEVPEHVIAVPEEAMEIPEEVVTTVEAPTETTVVEEAPKEKTPEEKWSSEIDEALSEVPESEFGLGDAISTEEKDPEETTFDEEFADVSNALRHIAGIQEIAVLGGEPSGTFDPSDLHVIKEEDIPLSHIVVADADIETMQRYAVTTNSEGMRRTAAAFFDPSTTQYKQIRKGLEELNQSLLDPSSYPYKMRTAYSQSGTNASLLAKDSLDKAVTSFNENKKNQNAKMPLSKAVELKSPDGESSLVSDSQADKSHILRKINANTEATITGTSAIKVASMLISGFRKVNLFNSGFYVVMVAPTLLQLTKYHNTVIERVQEFGFDLGQLACMPAGVETRAALMGLWSECVIESNLVDFNKDDNLAKALSALDVPVVAWALASLMYPKGTKIEHLCYNTREDGSFCRHSEVVNVSVNDMRYNNWSLLNATAIRYTDSKEPRTVEDCLAYREQHIKDNGTTVVISDDSEGTWKVKFHIPSLEDAQVTQRAYIAEMLASIPSGDAKERKEIEAYQKTKYLMALSPYISAILYTTKEDQKTLRFDDPVALESVLDHLQLADVSLPQKLMEYISSKTITHICFSHHTCPSCNKLPSDAINGLIPCDPEYTFFVWVTARLQQQAI